MRTGPTVADLSLGLCWRCSDDIESVHPAGFTLCLRACGPTLPPFWLAVARENGTDVFRCGNRGCVRWPLGSAPESRGALRSNAGLPRVGRESSLSFDR